MIFIIIFTQEPPETHLLPEPFSERALSGDQDEEGVARPHRHVHINLQRDHDNHFNHRQLITLNLNDNTRIVRKMAQGCVTVDFCSKYRVSQQVSDLDWVDFDLKS